MNDDNSLAHTKWNCKYHIVFAPKYRRKLFYGENRKEIGGILRQLSEWKGVKIVEAEVCPDHISLVGQFLFNYNRIWKIQELRYKKVSGKPGSNAGLFLYQHAGYIPPPVCTGRRSDR